MSPAPETIISVTNVLITLAALWVAHSSHQTAKAASEAAKAVETLARRQDRSGYIVARGLIESGSNAAVNHLRAVRLVFERFQKADVDFSGELLGVAAFARGSLEVAWIDLAISHAASLPKDNLESLSKLRSVLASFQLALGAALERHRRALSPDLDLLRDLAHQGEVHALDLWRSAFESSEERAKLPDPAASADEVAEAWIRGIADKI